LLPFDLELLLSQNTIIRRNKMPFEEEPITQNAQFKKAVRESVAEILQEFSATLSGIKPEKPIARKREWYNAEVASQLLDLDSPEKLHKKRRNGFFKQGVHYRNNNDSPNAKIPRWQYHVERCREALGKDPAKKRA
jgi:hypothetical protein